MAVAKIAERHGIDLWDYVGAQGGSLHKALDRLAYYWTRADEWPDYRNPLVPSPGPVWEIAYAHWQEPGWLDIVRESRPYGDEGHSAIRWTTLTNGVPFDPQVAAEPSAGMPSPGVPSPAPMVSPSAIVNNASTPVVDLQTSAFRPRVALFEKAWGRPGVHEIVVESLPRSGHATVAVDDIVTLTSTLREGS